MNILAICGAAQKSRNTATMLKNAFNGAMSVSGATGEIIYLYDLNFKGCIGCHSCKLLNKSKFAHCAVRDDLTPIITKALDTDVLLIGSPIYSGEVTGITRMFLERYLFPGMTWNEDHAPTYTKRTKVGWIFTMNATANVFKDLFDRLVSLTGRVLGESEYVTACQTQPLNDFSKYAATMFDADFVKKHHDEQFPKDCEAAFDMGKRLAESLGR